MTSIDMSQFNDLFFEESMEGLDSMEQGLLSLSSCDSDNQNQNIETINTIFRAAHSIKGGSGTFGFSDIANFTHALETLLDEARDGKRILDLSAIDILLKCCDCIRNMINAHRNNAPSNQIQIDELSLAVENILRNGNNKSTKTTEKKPLPLSSDILQDSFNTMLKDSVDNSASYDKTSLHQWHIRFKPKPPILLSGNEPLRIFRELETLGKTIVSVDASNLPDLAEIIPDECYLHWNITLESNVSKAEILEVFEWVMDECELDISELTATEKQPSATNFTNLQPEKNIGKTVDVATIHTKPKLNSSIAINNSSIRVSIEKIDDLINLVGELVITQSMLSELGNNFDTHKMEKLKSGLDQLLNNTKELQESVMGIRMVPISFAFNRFPRMIRDYATTSGKNVELVLMGENTELDKTIMEQLSDPLTHLVRNAIDHGIESSEERKQQGKNQTGTLTLNAYHKGGNIIVEISDDGHGIDSRKILAKAIQKGIISQDKQLSENEIYDLIFEPGFSTAETISDISGRGVGMDVVRRNLQAIGGRIDIETAVGKGTTFRIYLPLTLAILDGQLIRIGDDTFIVPLVSIVESLQMRRECINHVAGDMMLYRLREENIPIIPVHQEFEIRADNIVLEKGLLVVVEGDGQKIGLVVDDLLAQQQVVIKSLETNYRRIEGISGATILGDGSVALILDIPGFIQRSSKRSRNINAKAA